MATLGAMEEIMSGIERRVVICRRVLDIGPGARLAGIDLTGAQLAGIDLTGANLKGANLVGVDRSTANFRVWTCCTPPPKATSTFTPT